MEKMTEKQKAIKSAIIRCGRKRLKFDIENPFHTNEGLKAYYVQGTNKQCAFTEDSLMMAIYTGEFKKGLCCITAR
jgi:hypothetical protein